METAEPMGARPDLITGDLACPDENGELAGLAEVLGGVVCAMDRLMATALTVADDGTVRCGLLPDAA